MCTHLPQCPGVDQPDWPAARVTHEHPEQGWSRLCNGAVVFDDGEALLPNGQIRPLALAG